MKYRRLGRTDLKVSEIGLGTVELGMEYGIPVEGAPPHPSEKEAERILNRALDLGINFIDTARAYGTSESIIGRALEGRRKEFILASKVGCKPYIDSRNHILSSVRESLRALKTDVIDLMQIHSAPAEVIRSGEALDALQELQKAGCIRFLGVSVYGEEAALAAIETGIIDCIQVAYNALDREPELRIFPLARKSDVGVIVRSVLLKGALTYRHQYLPERLGELKRAAQRVAEVAEKQSISLPELAFSFVLRQPAISAALAGVTSLEELEAVVRFSDSLPLAHHAVAEIEGICVNHREQLSPANWSIP